MRKIITFACMFLFSTVAAFAAYSLSMDGSRWNILYSDNCPNHPTTVSLNGSLSWRIRMRSDCKPHYVMHGASDNLRSSLKDGGSTIVLTMSFSNVNAKSVQDGGSNVYATIMMQRRDDNLSGEGKYEFYRLWAGRHRIKIVNGSYTVTVPIDTTTWTGVFGRNPSSNQLNDTINNMQRIGVTFGGTNDFGHGIKGYADIYMNRFTAN